MGWRSSALVALVAANLLLAAWGLWHSEGRSLTGEAVPNPTGGVQFPARGDPGDGGVCYASPWTTDLHRVGVMVSNLRVQGYIVGTEEGVHEILAGHRVAASGRYRLREASRLASRAREEGFAAAAISTGADGRPTVAFGAYSSWVDAEAARRELSRSGYEAEVEPVYRTYPTVRAVVMAPLGRSSPLVVGTAWRPVDCQALTW